MSDEQTQGQEPTPSVENTSGETRVRVSRDDFIVAYENVANGPDPSYQAVADTLGLQETSVKQRASKYRKLGVDLTKMPRAGGAKFDVAAGQALLEKLRAEREAAQQETETPETPAE